MARFDVDLSRVQPPPDRQGVKVTRENTQHPSLRDMPAARGSMYASVPVDQRSATPKPVTAGVDRARTKHPAIQEQRVPASSEYQESPAKVTGAQQSQPSVP